MLPNRPDQMSLQAVASPVPIPVPKLDVQRFAVVRCFNNVIGAKGNVVRLLSSIAKLIRREAPGVMTQRQAGTGTPANKTTF
jgi:hypothetical protein